jgi:hypothetical protein
MTDQETVTLRGVSCVVVQCGTCGVIHTVPKLVYDNHRAEGGFHSCPNGHQRGWSKEGSEHERIRRERDRLAQQLAEKDDEIARQRRMREEAEGQVTKLKKRASVGVCPCCNRTFQQLARHMAQKHPTFNAESVPTSATTH